MDAGIGSPAVPAQWRHAWAKSASVDVEETPRWLPLHAHLSDTGQVIRLLWDEWLGDGPRRIISEDSGGDRAGRQIVTFAGAVHDIGKLTPAFAGQVPELQQEMERAGFRWGGLVREDSKRLPHGLAGHVIVAEYLIAQGVPRENAESLAVIVGGHHGVPPNRNEINHAEDSGRLFGGAEWGRARAGLIECVLDELSVRDAVESLRTVALSDASQLLIQGLVIMADWIASNADLFPLAARFEDVEESAEVRARRAWKSLGLPTPWRPTRESLTADPSALLQSRFGVDFPANEVQSLALSAARTMPEPGLILIEAIMGAGKTEAALLAAEVLAHRFGRSGVLRASHPRDGGCHVPPGPHLVAAGAGRRGRGARRPLGGAAALLRTAQQRLRWAAKAHTYGCTGHALWTRCPGPDPGQWDGGAQDRAHRHGRGSTRCASTT